MKVISDRPGEEVYILLTKYGSKSLKKTQIVLDLAKISQSAFLQLFV